MVAAIYSSVVNAQLVGEEQLVSKVTFSKTLIMAQSYVAAECECSQSFSSAYTVLDSL